MRAKSEWGFRLELGKSPSYVAREAFLSYVRWDCTTSMFSKWNLVLYCVSFVVPRFDWWSRQIESKIPRLLFSRSPFRSRSKRESWRKRIDFLCGCFTVYSFAKTNSDYKLLARAARSGERGQFYRHPPLATFESNRRKSFSSSFLKFLQDRC